MLARVSSVPVPVLSPRIAGDGSRARRGLGAALACFVTLAACQKSATPILERGDRALALGAYKPAIVEYRSALALGPSARAHRGLGLSYEALGANAEAERHLMAALSTRGDDAEARIALARVRAHEGQYGAAREELERTLGFAPESARALLLWGVYSDTSASARAVLEALEVRSQRAGVSPLPSHEREAVRAHLLARLTSKSPPKRSNDDAKLPDATLSIELAQAASEMAKYDLGRALLLPVVKRHPEQTDAWLILAEASLALGRLGDARRAMQALQPRRNEMRVRLLRARSSLLGGQQTQAVQELQSLLAELPEHRPTLRARVQRLLAEALLQAGKRQQAQVVLERLLEEHPGEADGTLALANLHLLGGEPDRAIEIASGLTGHAAQNPSTRKLLGRAYLRAGNDSAAEQTFRQLVEAAPHEPEAARGLALSLLAQDKTQPAQRLLESHRQRFPDDEVALTASLNLLEAGQGLRAASALLRKHAREHPDLSGVAAFEGRWWMQHGNVERGVAAYRRALSLDPSASEAVEALARTYAYRGKRALAQSVLDAAIADEPRDPEIWLLAARIQRELGRPRQAQESCDRALEISPEHPPTLALLAELHAEAFDQPDRARALAKQAYESAPGHARVRAALGWITHLGGDSQQALTYLETAAAQRPDDARLAYQLAATLLGTGRPADARRQLARVLAIDPRFPRAEEIRARLRQH